MPIRAYSNHWCLICHNLICSIHIPSLYPVHPDVLWTWSAGCLQFKTANSLSAISPHCCTRSMQHPAWSIFILTHLVRSCSPSWSLLLASCCNHSCVNVKASYELGLDGLSMENVQSIDLHFLLVRPSIHYSSWYWSDARQMGHIMWVGISLHASYLSVCTILSIMKHTSS